MNLVAVIVKDSEIDRVLDHLGLPRGFPTNKPARAPPLSLGGDAEGCQLGPPWPLSPKTHWRCPRRSAGGASWSFWPLGSPAG